jgi:molecular chaperone IbpA
MLHTNAISLFNNPKHFETMLQTSLGFEHMFDRLFGDLSNFHQQNSSGYPPYNLKKEGEHYIIELAVAGLSEKDIKVNVEAGVLTVESTGTNSLAKESENEFLHQGIARRNFKRSWTLSDDIVIKGAALNNGMLTVSMEKIIPEEQMIRQIPIVTNQK